MLPKINQTTKKLLKLFNRMYPLHCIIVKDGNFFYAFYFKSIIKIIPNLKGMQLYGGAYKKDIYGGW